MSSSGGRSNPVQPHLVGASAALNGTDTSAQSSPDDENTMFARPFGAPPPPSTPQVIRFVSGDRSWLPLTTHCCSNPFPSPTAPGGSVAPTGGGKHTEITPTVATRSAPVLDALRDYAAAAFKYQKQVSVSMNAGQSLTISLLAQKVQERLLPAGSVQRSVDPALDAQVDALRRSQRTHGQVGLRCTWDWH